MVTVVITTYKRKLDIVERAIRSVVAQTYRDWELIVVDDSPEDYEYRLEIKKMVNRYANDYQVVYHANPKSSGACFSRNVGLEMARGEFIAYLDDDDEWVPSKLERQTEAMNNADGHVALVYCPYYSIDEETGQKKAVKKPMRSGMLYEYLLEVGNIFGGMSMPLMRTACVKDVGGFDILMQSAQDMDLWLRLAKKYPVIYLDEPLVNYYIHGGDQISTNPYKRIAGLTRLNEKNRDYLETHKKAKWKREMGLIRFYLLAENNEKAFIKWKETACIWPGNILGNMKMLLTILLFRFRS